ncbi:MAG: hypothetical protein AAF611_00955 [Bacteroidota bacterium]
MFGGSGASFHVFGDLKRTRKRREKHKKRSLFDHSKRMYQDDGIQHEFPEITPHMRQQIRTQILEERRKSRRKLLMVLSITAVILAFGIYYILFGIKVSKGFFNFFTFGW